ncbi:MAG: porin [Burkholderiales bacterium]
MFKLRRKPLQLLIACALASGAFGTARADDTSEMKAKLEQLEQQIEALKAQMQQMSSQAQPQRSASAAPMVAQKPGSKLTFDVGGGEVTFYGHIDVSVDSMDNGLSGFVSAGGASPAGTVPVGKNGALTQVSSNLSYFGVRGSRAISNDLKGVFQFETQIDVSDTPGANPQAPDVSAQKSALGSRNSFVGLQASWGAVKIGKTDAPYKTSTGRMDPFSASVGDYNSIMANSGGDNRAEFDTRVPHSIWYESPRFNGVNVGILYSPGQNRSDTNDVIARGEPDCTGGNSPGPCTDGAFGDLTSLSATYTGGPLYAIAAYENHSKVNRSGDDPTPGAVGVADENAFKIGAQYKFATKTTLNVIFERLHRDAPVADYNERSHNASWIAVTQKISKDNDLNFGWAHAGKTPGDPGAGPIDNVANMYALGFKHHFEDKQTTWYLVAAEQKNHLGAHYDLGASGHGIVVDDKDAAGTNFSGTTLKAISTGLQYNF